MTFLNCCYFQLHIEDVLDTRCKKSIYSYNVSYFSQSFYLQAELFIIVFYMHIIHGRIVAIYNYTYSMYKRIYQYILNNFSFQQF